MVQDMLDRVSGTALMAFSRRLAGSIAGIAEKCGGMVNSGRVAAVRDELGRMLFVWKFKGLSDRMTTLSDALRVTAGNEHHFLEMGRTLQTVYADTAELIRYIQDAIKEVMGDTEDNILNKAGNLAKLAEAALARRQKRVADNLAQIRDVADHLGDLHKACDHLDRIAINLRVVGLNIGVESTRSPEGREMFTVVSKDILQLSETVDALANRIREDATGAMTEQLHAFNAITDGLQVLSNLTAEASHVVSEAVQETESGIEAFLKAFETADARFKKISNRVGEIVMGIQFHDNMRQRVEHITDALDDSGRILDGRFPESAAADPGGGQDSRTSGAAGKAALGRACSVVALQKIQLTDVIAEINRVHRESTAAFGEIDLEIAEMGGIMSAVGTDIHGPEGKKDGACPDSFSKLIDALTGLNKLLGRGDELGRRIEESVARVSEIGCRFSAHLNDVDTISFETKIKALNAIVKAGHMSDAGRTLEVLAQEMDRLSEQTNGFVADVEKKLKQVGEFGNRVRKTGNAAGEDAGDGSSDISGILGEGIGDIVRMRKIMDTRVEKTSEMAGVLRTEVSGTISDLGFLKDLAVDMSGHLEVLDDVNNRLSPAAEKWKDDVISGEDQLTGRYTMNRERMLHDAVFSSGNGPTEEGTELPDDIVDTGKEVSLPGNDEESIGKPPAEEEEDAFGDNIELF